MAKNYFIPLSLYNLIFIPFPLKAKTITKTNARTYCMFIMEKIKYLYHCYSTELQRGHKGKVSSCMQLTWDFQGYSITLRCFHNPWEENNILYCSHIYCLLISCYRNSSDTKHFHLEQLPWSFIHYNFYSLTIPPSASTFLDGQLISACILAFTVILLPFHDEIGHRSAQITAPFPYPGSL